MNKLIMIGAIIIATLAISACSSTPAAAPGQPAGTSTTASSAENSEPKSVEEMRAEMFAEEKVQCRYERTVGSRLGKKVCRTESQREAERIAGQEALERNARMHSDEGKVTGE